MAVAPSTAALRATPPSRFLFLRTTSPPSNRPLFDLVIGRRHSLRATRCAVGVPRWIDTDQREHSSEGGAVVRCLRQVVTVDHVVVLAALIGAGDARVERLLRAEVGSAAPVLAFGEIEP